jgi:hypothetical protein
MSARLAATDANLAGVIREQQDAHDEWQRIDASLMRALAAGKNSEVATLEAQQYALGRRIDDLSSQIKTKFQPYDDLANPQPLPVEDVQRLLATDEELLLYLSDGDNGWLWAVRPDTVRVHRVEIGSNHLTQQIAGVTKNTGSQAKR